MVNEGGIHAAKLKAVVFAMPADCADLAVAIPHRQMITARLGTANDAPVCYGTICQSIARGPLTRWVISIFARLAGGP